MRAEKLKAIVMDVDGTLTDGTINIGAKGELFKSFYVKDGVAIKRAMQNDVRVVILTSRKSEIVQRRAEELGIEIVLQDAGDKKRDMLEECMRKYYWKKEELAYIGDDINDIDCMTLCKWVGCPADAVDQVKEMAGFVSTKDGGRGAVREFIDWLL